MITCLEEIANLTTKDKHGLEFGRIRIGDIDRYFFRIRGEFIALKEETLAQFLAKIQAYAVSNDTLFRIPIKSGISTGTADTSQRVDFQPSEQPHVKECGLYQGA